MNTNFNELKKKFDIDGYFICKNIISKNIIEELIDEINVATNTVKYFDNYNNIRRIEKLYDKGQQLKNTNQTILNLLKNVFQEDFLIFKDKFNAKPPGGEGFFAHYDGIFKFVDQNNNLKRGWYEYGDFFINVLIAIDKCDKTNGALELAKKHKGTFDQLLNNTKKNSTPALLKKVEEITTFELINLDIGDVVIFSNTCPHRSKDNYSKSNRRILYYTYSLAKNGSKYDIYFDDKDKSKNISKALVEK